MTPVQSPEAGPAPSAGPASAAPTSPARPVVAEGVITADNTSRAQPVAPHGRLRPDPGGRRRVVLVAAAAGALLAGGLAWTMESKAPPGPPTITITAHHSRYEPDRVKVNPGETVRFVIHNADPIDHEFIIGPPETHAIHERGTPHFHTGAVQGEVTVPAGMTVETTWTFGPSGSPPVEYGCHLAGHWAYGMHGKALIR